MEICAVCSSELRGRQRKFCSRSCKNRYTNYHHQSYESQQARGRERKLNLIAMLGGECIRCGYSRNYGALEFHHIDPALKQFQLDMRSLANLRWELIIEEVAKCALLCANCHAEEHNPGSILIFDPNSPNSDSASTSAPSPQIPSNTPEISESRDHS
jgi:hypothetical protein